MPPQAICNAYKKYQKMEDADVDSDPEIIDFQRGLSDEQKRKIHPVGVIPSELIASTQRAFKSHGQAENGTEPVSGSSELLGEACTIYEHKEFPGKYYT